MVTDGLQNATTPHASVLTNNASTSNPNDGPPHEVCTISRGHAIGDLAKVRKNSVRLAWEIALGHQINMAEHVAKLSKRENTVISFIDDEMRRLNHLYILPDECRACHNKADKDTIIWIWWGKGVHKRGHPIASNHWITPSIDHLDGRLSLS